MLGWRGGVVPWLGRWARIMARAMGSAGRLGGVLAGIAGGCKLALVLSAWALCLRFGGAGEPGGRPGGGRSPGGGGAIPPRPSAPRSRQVAASGEAGRVVARLLGSDQLPPRRSRLAQVALVPSRMFAVAGC